MIKFNPESKEWSGMELPSVLNPEANLGHIILNSLERNPSKITQISADTGVEITCHEMRLRTIRAAQNLTKLGFKQGDMIGVACKNHEDLAPIIFGCFCIGAPMNGLDPTFSKEDMAHMLGVTKPILVLCDQENFELVKEAAKEVNISPRYVVFGLSTSDSISVGEILKESGTEHLYFPRYLGDSSKLTGFIPCSSGTTGPPKGVCVSHSQLIYQNSGANNLGTGVLFYYGSMYWISGVMILVKGVFDGLTRIITTKPFNPAVTFKIIEKYKVTHMLTPPRMIVLLFQSPRVAKADLSSLRFFVSGGGIISESLRKEVQKYLPNGKLSYQYGLTECGGTATTDIFVQRAGSSGFLVPNMRAKIINDDGVALDNGETGEICIRSKYTFLGYYNNEQATSEILDADGWLRTGDIGYFDKDGFIYCVDRKKEIFKYNGYQISPVELELLVDKFEDVVHVAVCGIHDETVHTDLPAAVVELKEGATLTEAEIIEHVDNNVSAYKKLRGGLYFIDKMPMTKSGKIQKRMAKEFATECFNKRKLTK